MASNHQRPAKQVPRKRIIFGYLFLPTSLLVLLTPLVTVMDFVSAGGYQIYKTAEEAREAAPASKRKKKPYRTAGRSPASSGYKVETAEDRLKNYRPLKLDQELGITPTSPGGAGR